MNPSTPPPRVVIKNNTVREAFIAGACVIAILAMLGFAVMQLREKPKGNTLTGEVVAREFAPLKERMVDFSGTKIKGTRESKGEFVLKVRVDSEGGRVFEVPVPEATYQSKKEGDSLTFVRPPSEQK